MELIFHKFHYHFNVKTLDYFQDFFVCIDKFCVCDIMKFKGKKMDKKYKVFQKGFNGVLDLIETADGFAFKSYENLINSLPKEIVEKLYDCDDFNVENVNYNADLLRTVNAVSLEFISYKDYLKTDIFVRRIFEEELYKEDVDIKLFAYAQRNTTKKQEPFKMFFNKQGDDYVYQGDNQGDDKILDTTCEIFLQRKGDDFYLLTKRNFRGWEIYKKTISVSFDEVLQCLEDEDEYEEEMEVEFDAEFDL